MKHAHTLLGAALVVAFTTSAIAADPASPTGNKADKTQVVPSRSDLQPGAAPTVQRMDDNAQRQHDPNSAAARNAGPAKSAGTATPAAASAGDVRDWAAIDKNKDNLISPDEMESYLTQSRSAAAPKS
jgi:hypothetical protein